MKKDTLVEVLKDYLELGKKAFPYIATQYFVDGKGYQVLSQHIKFLLTSQSSGRDETEEEKGGEKK